ncbi:MAG TPA: Gfo/Idh/MocA family oxidoreductase [Acidimicrobiales bacterium]|nr:Gfo/Idh/MocA family oxidoreductase [Acidimicrobiales bacterium]
MTAPARDSGGLVVGRPVRVAVVGLGRVFDLNARAFVDHPDVEVVALVDPREERRVERGAAWPGVPTFPSIDALAKSGVEVDAVEALLPITEHARGVAELVGHGWHVNLQKPMALDLDEAVAMAAAARDAGVRLRVMENYLFYEPLRRLKALLDEGQLGEVVGYHLKMVASGRGGWEVPWENYLAQFALTAKDRGVLLFDDGWHKISTALWLFGPIREVRAWVGATEVLPGHVVDAPSTVAWEHESGVRGVWDATVAIDLYLRSDFYTNDERWEVTCRGGFARVNRCTSRGLQQPSLEVYRDGELRQYHALDDDWASSFVASGRHWIQLLRTGTGPACWGPEEAIEVLRVALAIQASSARGGVGIDPASLA